MIAQIKNIERNATKEGQGGKTYKGTAVTYQGQTTERYGAKPPVTRFLFAKSDIEKQFLGADVKVDDWVEIAFDDTQWKNPERFEVCPPPAGAGRPATPNNVKPNIPAVKGGFGNLDTQLRIARAVAIKEAGQLVATMAANGGYTATNLKKKEFLVEEILFCAKAFEPWLCMEEDDDALMKDLEGNAGEDFNQEGFDD